MVTTSFSAGPERWNFHDQVIFSLQKCGFAWQSMA